MVKRCIGIDVGSSYLCAVQVLRIGRAFCIEKVFDKQARRDTDDASNTLKALVNKYGFDRRATVAISMPSDSVFFRSLETDSIGLERVRASDHAVFDHDFPIETDQMLTQPCSYYKVTDQKYSILTAGVARDSVRQTREIVLGARMRPNFIGTTVFSVHTTVALNHPEIRMGVAIIAHMAESYLTMAVTQNNRILAVRQFPIATDSDGNGETAAELSGEVLSREAAITWRKLFETEIEQDTKVYLAGAGENIAGFREAIEERLHCQTIVVNPFARVLLKDPRRPRVDISVAEGLALRTLAPEHTAGINFLDADSTREQSKSNLRKEFTICALLIGAIAAVSLFGLFMRVSRLEGRYTQIKREIEESFRNALPEEKNIVNPLAQLDQKLQSMSKDHALFSSYSGAGPLKILLLVTEITPEDMNISLDDVLISSQSIRLAGTAESFESLYNWQRLLEETPEFANVDVGDPQRAADGKLVRFLVQASLTGRDRE